MEVYKASALDAEVLGYNRDDIMEPWIMGGTSRPRLRMISSARQVGNRDDCSSNGLLVSSG